MQYKPAQLGRRTGCVVVNPNIKFDTGIDRHLVDGLHAGFGK